MSVDQVKTVSAQPDEAEDAVVPKPGEAVTVSPSMGSAVLTGLGWKVATVLVSDVTRIGTAVVLARLLTPEDTIYIAGRLPELSHHIGAVRD